MYLRNTAVAIALVICGLAVAQDNPNANIVKATMIADTTAVQPDTTFTLGVLFKVQPGWHIYWRNPGSSGLATKVVWSVPEGGSVGETLYPAPFAFTAPGDIVSYGYEDEVLLMTQARVSSKASGEVELNAKCSWLMCSDRCIPGKQNVTLKLLVGAGQPANEEIFNRYRPLIPRQENQLPDDLSVKSSAAAGKTILQLTVAPTAGAMLVGETRHPDLHEVYFFPDMQEGWAIDPPQISAPGASAQVGGAATKVHTAPVSITVTAQPEGAATKGAPLAKGVLVRQPITKDGKPGPVRASDLNLTATGR